MLDTSGAFLRNLKGHNLTHQEMAEQFLRRVAELEAENTELRARVAELEAAQAWRPAIEPPINTKTVILSMTIGGKTLSMCGYHDGRNWRHPFEMCVVRVNGWTDLPRMPEAAKGDAQ